MNRTRITLTVSAGLLLLFTSPASAGRFNKVLSVGDEAPAWSKLEGIDGRPHSLADWKDAKAVVVVFISNLCPVASMYEERLVKLTADYRDKGVAVVAVNVSNAPGDRLEKMKARAAESGFNFAYLVDPSQRIGRAYGATCTPHAFVLNGERRVAYMGAIDDNMDAAAARRHFLRDAIDAVLSGKAPAVRETRQRGCEIEYDER